MTTEGKGSVLKTALGLKNLKGLGDTLKQIKELKEQLMRPNKHWLSWPRITVLWERLLPG